MKVATKKKRCYILFEVLFAILFVVICFIPLLDPHIFIAKQESLWLVQNELETALNRAAIEVIEKLYTGEIPWDKIISESKEELSAPSFSWMHQKNIQGTVKFTVKNKKTDDSKTKGFYIINLEVKLEQKKISKELSFDVFIENKEESSNAS